MKLVNAYKVEPNGDPVYDRIVAIVYRDDHDRRCTMFVQTGTEPGIQVLIDLINGVAQGES